MNYLHLIKDSEIILKWEAVTCVILSKDFIKQGYACTKSIKIQLQLKYLF